jgi:YidC/Oxa1 family membrane protein insertase
MDWQKSLNLVAIGLVAWLLIIEWDRFGAREGQAAVVGETQSIVTEASEIPSEPVQDLSSDLPQMQVAPEEVSQTKQTSRLVTVSTDLLQVTIDTLGGDIVDVRLLKHLTAMADDGGEPFTLLTRSDNHLYIAQSGLIGANATGHC